MPYLIGRGRGVTVIIMPLKSLIDSVRKDYKKIGLGYLVQNNKNKDLKSRRRRLMFKVKVVIIAPEGVNRKEFSKFLDDLEVRERLDRVVINKCHYMLDVFNSQRVRMLNLREMVKREIRVLFLTGTLPERSIGRQLEVIDLRRNNLVIIRDKTVRPELRYSIIEQGRKVKRDRKLEGLVRRGREKFKKGGKVLVFRESMKVYKELGKKYRQLVYYAEVGSNREKKRILEKQISSDYNIIIRTTVLGIGVNCLDHRIVIHIRISQGFVKYYQELGRYRRDRRLGECQVLKGRFKKLGQKKYGEEKLVEGKRFLSGNVCIRGIIDRVIDKTVRKNGCLKGKKELYSVYQKIRGRSNVIERKGLVNNNRNGIEEIKDSIIIIVRIRGSVIKRKRKIIGRIRGVGR